MKREITEDLILENNIDLNEEEAFDEFAKFIKGAKKSKILITTNLKPTRLTFEFLTEIKNFLPNCFYYPRNKHTLIEISKFALEKDFTHILSVNERLKKPYSLSISVLNTGPTLTFRIRNYIPSFEIYNKGNPTGHNPELILKNFNTALGRRVARSFSTLFDSSPEFKARTVVTFHNQRDFIFFRHHRYIFNETENEEFKNSEDVDKRINVRLQEIGPRFVMQLQKVYSGNFNEKYGDYEFLYHANYYVKRNKFYL
jgi:ribosome production factor 1